MLRCGHISHYSENALSINIQHIDCYSCIKGLKGCLRMKLLIFIYSIMGPYANMSPSDKPSDTQVTDKVCRPLVRSTFEIIFFIS